MAGNNKGVTDIRTAYLTIIRNKKVVHSIYLEIPVSGHMYCLIILPQYTNHFSINKTKKS